jgi:mannosyltransferase
MSLADEHRALAHRVLAIGILLGALFLRCLAIDRFSLGNDEIQEVRWSRLPWHQLLRQAGSEGAHPPLEFSLQMVISKAGAPEWVRRVPSVLAGVGGVALAMFLARRWFGRIASLVSGLLLACSPIHIRFSQEVRPYALGLFMLLASLAALEQYRLRPDMRFALLWFVSTLGALYTLYFAGMMSVLVSVVFIFLYRKTRLKALWRTLPFTIAGWSILYLPWLPLVVSVAWRPPLFGRETLDRAWLTYHLQVLGTGDWKVESISMGSYVFWAFVCIGLIAAHRSRPAVLMSAWLVLGGALQLIILQLRPHFPAVRHFLPSWLAGALLAGYAIHLAERHAFSLGLYLAGLGVILLADFQTLGAYYDHGRPQWNAVAGYLRQHAEPGERIVAASGWGFRNLGFYWVDEQLGRIDVPLERAGATVPGPAWIVTATCPMSAEIRRRLDELELMAAFPTTNYCEIRYLPDGSKLTATSGICSNDP